MKELFKTGGEMPDTNYVFMVSISVLSYLYLCLSVHNCTLGLQILLKHLNYWNAVFTRHS